MSPSRPLEAWLRCALTVGSLALSLAGALPGAAASHENDSLATDAEGRVGAGTLTPPSAPRLAVVLLLDQFRADFLDRFAPAFGDGGFRRLEAQGARFTDCTIPYAQTLTAPGHATLLTGTTPRTHGIVGNGWYEASESKDVSAASDPRVRSVGGLSDAGSSPWRLRAQTVGDVLRGSTRGAGKVIAISDKARAAVLPGGHHANAAYWLDESTGRMESSTYYMNALPAWVEAANRGRRPEQAWEKPWTPFLPSSAYSGTVVANGARTFPHRFTPDGKLYGFSALTVTPWALTSLFEFARQAVVGEKLGADRFPDLLSVSVSVTDRVGHLFGPDSPEALDLAARTDREIARFLRFLDDRVGAGRYVVVLTADHGAATTPSFARRYEAVRADSIGAIADSGLAVWAKATLNRAFARGGRRPLGEWARAVGEGNLWLDRDSLAVAGISVADAARALADSARAVPWLAAGFDARELSGPAQSAPYWRSVSLGYFPGRSGDVIFVPRPFGFFGWGPQLRGDHGTPYRYDTHVPLVWMGPGVRHGVYRQPSSTVDIAPTLAFLLGVEAPAQSEGRVLFEALRLPRDR